MVFFENSLLLYAAEVTFWFLDFGSFLSPFECLITAMAHKLSIQFSLCMLTCSRLFVPSICVIAIVTHPFCVVLPILVRAFCACSIVLLSDGRSLRCRFNYTQFLFFILTFFKYWLLLFNTSLTNNFTFFWVLIFCNFRFFFWSYKFRWF